MSRILYRLTRLARDERGQALPLAALAMTALLGMAAFGIDLGHARYTYRMLQATTDSAALAAARAVPTATSSTQIIGNGGSEVVYGSVSASGVAAEYSSISGALNQRSSLPSPSVISKLECLNALLLQGNACLGHVPYNAVQVSQSLTLPMYFAGVLGHPTIPLSTTSTAAVRGGSPRPANIVIVMDSTLSMDIYDDNCGATQMTCALNGMQNLLKALNPCGEFQGNCAVGGVVTNSFQRVSLFTFPNLTVGTASLDSTCTTPMQATTQNGYWTVAPYGVVTVLPMTPWSTIPSATAYSFPTVGATSYNPSGSTTATYRVLDFRADYKTSDAATSLNGASALVAAAGGKTSCGSMLPSNFDGDFGTYYAGAIYAAQSALVYEQSQNTASDNIMIILGDGDSNAPHINTVNGQTVQVFPPPATGNGTYPSWVGECGQAITAANYATSNGTYVYTVAYGSSAIAGCTSDAGAGSNPNVSPCDAMGKMASAPQMFFSDWKQTGSDGTCLASQPYTSLNDIFKAIAADISQARLIPNTWT